ncbi:MAG: alpha/beta fold hydrolase [Candidatus Melainabacteria bacterium]|nr:alpha/beta fold hydrolase [Candidatus Melainabacteria bacterium]
MSKHKHIIFAIHGLGGHSGWFKNLADELAKHNIAFASFDLPGFGKNHNLVSSSSQFTKGHVESFQTWIEAADTEFQKLIANEPDAQITVMGHSLGALIAAMMPSLTKDHKLILSVPGFKGASDTFDPGFFWSTIRKIVIDKFILGNDVYVTLPPSPKKYPDPTEGDPLKVSEVTQTLLLEVLKMRAACKKQMPQVHSPVLMFKIEGDTVVDNNALPLYLDLIPHSNKELKVYSGADHDWIWREQTRTEISKKIASYLEE